MKLIKLSLFALLAVSMFTSCKTNPQEEEVWQKLLDKTWAIETMSMRVEGDTVLGMTYDNLDEILTFSYETNGSIYGQDSFKYIFEEWVFLEGKAFSGSEFLRQFCLPFQRDSLCTLLNPEKDEMVFAAWSPLESSDPGQFLGFSIALPRILSAVQDEDGNADLWAALYLYLRGEITWLNDSAFVLENMSHDPAFPNSEYTFNIRVREVKESLCKNPAHCLDWVSKIDSCENGNYSWASCRCDCDEGWGGINCDQQVCENPPACVNGTAVAQGMSCECSCDSGWTGYFCDSLITTPVGIDCDTSTISCVNGFRVASEDSTQCNCHCYPGWEGPDCSLTQAKTVTTLAGSGLPGLHNGNGANARFNEPRGIVADNQGNIYVADAANNVIRKVTPSGMASTYAGTGAAGYYDGPADSAMFHNPSGLTIDLQGNLYVADHFNHVIRKIATDGAVSTLAGTGNPGATNGALASAEFMNPFAIVWDTYKLLGAEVLLVADRGTNTIRKVDLNTGMVSVFAGSFNPAGGNVNGDAQTASFREIMGMSFSSYGELYLVERGNHAVRMISITNGAADQVYTYAGQRPNGQIVGMAANDPLNYPLGIVWQFPNLLYVADGSNHRIRLFVDTGFGFGSHRDVAGSLQNQSGFTDDLGSAARFSTPFGLCIDDSNVMYASEQGNNAIRILK